MLLTLVIAGSLPVRGWSVFSSESGGGKPRFLCCECSHHSLLSVVREAFSAPCPHERGGAGSAAPVPLRLLPLLPRVLSEVFIWGIQSVRALPVGPTVQLCIG